MFFTVNLRPSHLKVFSGVLTNIGAGFLLLPFTIRNILVLIESVVLAIVCIGLAIKLEDLLGEL